jgi:hypothetical protein
VARESSVGLSDQWLNCASIRIKEIVLPDYQDSNKQAMFHHKCSYAISKLYNPGPNRSTRWTLQDDSGD